MSMPGRRWATTRYKVGDRVKVDGFEWKIYRIDIVRGPDKHPKPMYRLMRQYPNPKGKGVKPAVSWASGSRLKLIERAS